MVLQRLAGALLLVLGTANAEPVKDPWLKVKTCGTGEYSYIRIDTIMGFGHPNTYGMYNPEVFVGCIGVMFMNGRTVVIKGNLEQLMNYLFGRLDACKEAPK